METTGIPDTSSREGLVSAIDKEISRLHDLDFTAEIDTNASLQRIITTWNHVKAELIDSPGKTGDELGQSLLDIATSCVELSRLAYRERQVVYAHLSEYQKPKVSFNHLDKLHFQHTNLAIRIYSLYSRVKKLSELIEADKNSKLQFNETRPQDRPQANSGELGATFANTRSEDDSHTQEDFQGHKYSSASLDAELFKPPKTLNNPTPILSLSSIQVNDINQTQSTRSSTSETLLHTEATSLTQVRKDNEDFSDAFNQYMSHSSSNMPQIQLPKFYSTTPQLPGNQNPNENAFIQDEPLFSSLENSNQDNTSLINPNYTSTNSIPMSLMPIKRSKDPTSMPPKVKKWTTSLNKSKPKGSLRHQRAKKERELVLFAIKAGKTNILQEYIDSKLWDILKVDESLLRARTAKLSLLMEATRSGHLECAKILVYAGWTVDAVDPQGRMALHFAIENGRFELVRWLVDEYPSASANTDNTLQRRQLEAHAKPFGVPLLLALNRKEIAIADFLIGLGANINCVNEIGETPLIIATKIGSVSTIVTLLQKGANRLAIDHDGNSALHYASMKGQLSLIMELYASLEDFEVVNDCGEQPIHVAALSGQHQVVAALLRIGCNANSWTRASDIKGYKTPMPSTPLHHACSKGHWRTVKELIDFGAMVNSSQDDGTTALIMACKAEDHHSVSLLLASGADANAQTQTDLSSALHVAARTKNWHIIEALLRYGANPTLTNKEGDTPSIEPLSLSGSVRAANVSEVSRVTVLQIFQTIQYRLKGLLKWGRKILDISILLPTSKTESEDSTSSAQETDYLLMCTNDGPYATAMRALGVHDLRGDEELFRELQKFHSIKQGGLSRLFSFTKIKEINFVKFSLRRNALVDCIKKNQLPPRDAQHYDFSPRPAALIPPIGSNYLLHRLHNPEDGKGDTLCLEQFPKRLHQRPERGVHPDNDIGWGLDFVEGPHFGKIYTVLAICVGSGSLLFGFLYWVIKKDIQGAFSVASYLTSLMVLFLSTWQIRVLTR